MGRKYTLPVFLTVLVALLLTVGSVYAQDAPEEPPTLDKVNQNVTDLRNEANWLWTCLAAFLVFFMQAGFAMVEAGFTRAKNTVNILTKNVMDFAVGSIVFWAVGFGLMFGVTNGWFGTDHFLLTGNEEGAAGKSWLSAFWLFQVVFCATAATIVSGAVAERTKFVGYLIYSATICAFVYPVFGSWAWGSLYLGAATNAGWMESLGDKIGMSGGFLDFAGSTVVHSVGGWAALAGALVLGPRIGKYGKDGKPRAIPGHSIPMAALGVFILWLGWFGFNPGSTTTVGGGSFASIAVTTNLAGAAGAITALFTSWTFSAVKKPDLTMTLNGALAGLVGITCPCNIVTNGGAIIIGAVAGILVYFSVLFFDRIHIDDPVGAVSVHGVCGAWGTLAAGLFGTEVGLFYGYGANQLVIQAVGVLVCFAWSFGICVTLFLVLRAVGLLRVSPEHEIVGLDISEMGLAAYTGVQVLDSHEQTYLSHEPRGAKVPSGSGRFEVVIDGISNGELMHSWSELCQPGEGSPPAPFTAVYPYMTTVKENRFNFCGGDPETIRGNLEKLFKERIGPNIKARIEA